MFRLKHVLRQLPEIRTTMLPEPSQPSPKRASWKDTSPSPSTPPQKLGKLGVRPRRKIYCLHRNWRGTAELLKLTLTHEIGATFATFRCKETDRDVVHFRLVRVSTSIAWFAFGPNLQASSLGGRLHRLVGARIGLRYRFC